MDEKIMLRSLIDLYELSFQLSDELEQLAGNAERLSGYLYQLFEQINPVPSNDWDEDETWDKYKERTIKYIIGGNK
jgi:hypothetical protein